MVGVWAWLFCLLMRAKLAEIAERVTATIKPIRIEGFTTLDQYKGLPEPNAVVLKDGTIIPLEKEVVGAIDGVNVNMLSCRLNNMKYFITLEFRGYYYPTVN